MLLRNIEPVELKRLVQKTGNDMAAKRFAEHYKAGDYDTYFSYDSIKRRLLYEAVPKTDDLPYVGIFVSHVKDITDLYGVETPLADSFALALHEREEKEDDNQLRGIYGPLFDILYPIAFLSREDAKIREEQAHLFEDFSRSMQEAMPLVAPAQATPVNTGAKLKLSFTIKESRYSWKCYLVKAEAGYDYPRAVKDTNDFVRKTIFGGDVEIGRSIVSIAPQSLTSADAQACAFLLKQGFLPTQEYYAADRNYVCLTLPDLISFFFELKGRQIEYLDTRYQIDGNVITPLTTMDEDGKIHLTPTFSGKILINGLFGATIQKEERKITLISFSSLRESKLFSFILSHPDFRFDLFQSEMNAYIVPLIENCVQISEAYKAKHPYRKDEIRYYVDYRNDDTLEVKTQYFFGSDEVDENSFNGNPIDAKKNRDFRAALYNLNLPLSGRVSDPQSVLKFLKADLLPLQQSAIVYLSDNIAKKKISSVGKVNVRTSSGIDWLEVSLSSNQYSEEELEEILSAYRKKKKFIRLKDTFIDLDDSAAKELGEFLHDFDLDAVTSKKLPLYQALKLQAYQGDDFDVTYCDKVKQMMDDIKNFKQSQVTLNQDLLHQMRPYQVDGVRWMSVLANHRLSGILADDMGLGKTLQIIALLSLSTIDKPVLIVSPKSLIYNWENEFRKWNPKQRTSVLDGDKAARQSIISQISVSGKTVYITSYDSLRNDLDSFKGISFSYLILDEGQNIANVYAKKTRAVKKIEADHHFVLTGTPIQNSLMDLWSIFDFMMPGFFDSYQDFHRAYGKLTIDDEASRLSLMKKVMPFVLKRTKKEVLSDLPPKDEQIMTIAMNEDQRKLYDAFLQKAKNSASAVDATKILILAALTRLRQICVDPKMFIENYDADSEKLTETIRLLKESIAGGHKVLIFSVFAKTLIHFQETLKKNKISSYLIYGDTDAKDRLRMADSFNTKEDVKVMLVSLRAGGTGLNLIGADIVIHLDPWWNLAAENQASDRAHRIGQTRSVTIFKLVCKNSIEEKVIELQNRKKNLSAIIQEGDEGIGNLSDEDLKYLLS